jgi:CDP-glucose 4,6-dehydratase
MEQKKVFSISKNKAGIFMNFWNNKNILVTGATGLLGPWLVRKLLEKKSNVIILARDFVPDSLFFNGDLHKKVLIAWGDLLDFHLIQRVLNEFNIDTILHLGAQAIVGYANRSPLSTFKSNIEGTWNLLENCRMSPWVKKIIIASSDKAYGEQNNLPYKENTPLEGRHPYDVSKSCADLIAQSYFHTYQLPVCITRCGNFFGPGDLHFNRIIPGTIKSLINNKSPIIRSDGTFIRDYIYVKDVADAYICLAEQMERKEIIGQCFNFSTDQPYSVIDIVEIIKKLMNKENIKSIIQNQACNEIHKQHLCSQKAKKLLQWNPAYGINQGLIATIAWYKEFLKRESNDRSKEKNFHCGSMLQ